MHGNLTAAAPNSLSGGILRTLLTTLLTASSRMASIFCFVSPTTLQGRMPLPNELPSAVRTALPTLCPLQGIFPYNALMMASTVVIPHPHLPRPFIVHRPRLISLSPRSSAQAFRIPTFATWRMKEVVIGDNSLHRIGCRPSFGERERGKPPFVLGLWQTSNVVVNADLHGALPE